MESERDFRPFIRRYSKQVLRPVVIPSACAVKRARGVVRRFHGDIATRVSGSYYQHPLVFQRVGSLVLGGMHREATEVPWIAREVRIPAMTVRDKDPPVATCLAAFQGHIPILSALGRLDASDGLVEPDVVIESKGASVRAQVLEHQRMVDVGGVSLRHRKVGIFAEPLGSDQMRGAANTTIRLSEVPVAAYVVFPLDNFDGDIPLLQVFRRRQAGG